MHRSRIHLLMPLIVLPALTPRLWPQTAAPQIYSYIQDPAPSLMGPSFVKVARDGPKEAIDQILPVGPGRAKEFHNHILYDFQAHKIYTKLVSDPSVPCSIMTYTSPAVPDEFDVITASADSMKDFLAHAKLLRRETVNGIPSKVMELNADQMKVTAWIADPGGFPVKEVMTGEDGKATTMLEVKKLSFARPPASAFETPKGCTAIQGEATATGARAEFGTGETTPKPSVSVTAVTLESVPDYTGPCPVKIRLTGNITVDGPGKVFYQFGAGKMEPGDTVTFTTAGSKTVSHVITFNHPEPGYGNEIGVGAILEAIGEDTSGNHDASMKGSNNASFSINCTGNAAAAPARPPYSPPTPQAAQPAPAHAGNAGVTSVAIQVTPQRYTGVCPVTVKLIGTFTASGPGPAYFQFQAGAVAASSSGAVNVGADDTATVTSEGQVRRTPQVQSVRFLAGMEPRGHQENAKFTDVQLDIHCTNAP
ncbi:MAG: hypothetical protein ABSE36_12055 [Terracidiphilus sp.]|jgi:hypothetical protein